MDDSWCVRILRALPGLLDDRADAPEPDQKTRLPVGKLRVPSFRAVAMRFGVVRGLRGLRGLRARPQHLEEVSSWQGLGLHTCRFVPERAQTKHFAYIMRYAHTQATLLTK